MNIDNNCQFMLNEMMVHDLFPFGIRGCIQCSKNVLDERYCPSEIILGLDDPDFSILLNIGLYLECTWSVCF